MIFDDSRYALADLLVDTTNNSHYFELRDRLLYDDMDDTIMYIAKAGDTIHSLAAQYYGTAIGNGDAGLWWVIADFQPTPIHDPTIALEPGQVILLPPLDAIQEALLGSPDELLQGV